VPPAVSSIQGEDALSACAAPVSAQIVTYEWPGFIAWSLTGFWRQRHWRREPLAEVWEADLGVRVMRRDSWKVLRARICLHDVRDGELLIDESVRSDSGVPSAPPVSTFAPSSTGPCKPPTPQRGFRVQPADNFTLLHFSGTINASQRLNALLYYPISFSSRTLSNMLIPDFSE
jgi:hypothetical protein